MKTAVARMRKTVATLLAGLLISSAPLASAMAEMSDEQKAALLGALGILGVAALLHHEDHP
jgi:hypothetical protein